jgi:hypothetical protein
VLNFGDPAATSSANIVCEDGCFVDINNGGDAQVSVTCGAGYDCGVNGNNTDTSHIDVTCGDGGNCCLGINHHTSGSYDMHCPTGATCEVHCKPPNQEICACNNTGGVCTRITNDDVCPLPLPPPP